MKFAANMERLNRISLGASYVEAGYEVFDGVLDEQYCEALAARVGAAMGRACIDVNRDGIRMQTLNGRELVAAVPELQAVHDAIYVRLAASIPGLLMLDDLPVAISANLLRIDQGHAFRMHFDRHEHTAVLYLTASADLPLCLHPHIRTDPVMGESVWHYSQDARPAIRVNPRPGRLLCFHGRTTLHGVIPDLDVPACGNRVSLQFGYDTRRRSFEGQQYYGRPGAT